jgi:hypothetical protein
LEFATRPQNERNERGREGRDRNLTFIATGREEKDRVILIGIRFKGKGKTVREEEEEKEEKESRKGSFFLRSAVYPGPFR